MVLVAGSGHLPLYFNNRLPLARAVIFLPLSRYINRKKDPRLKTGVNLCISAEASGKYFYGIGGGDGLAVLLKVVF